MREKKTLNFPEKVLAGQKELLPLPPRKGESSYRDDEKEARDPVAKKE